MAEGHAHGLGIALLLRGGAQARLGVGFGPRDGGLGERRGGFGQGPRARAALADASWAGLAREVYLFIAVFFFLCCFGMSRYSLYLEKKLNTGY